MYLNLLCRWVFEKLIKILISKWLIAFISFLSCQATLKSIILYFSIKSTCSNIIMYIVSLIWCFLICDLHLFTPDRIFLYFTTLDSQSWINTNSSKIVCMIKVPFHQTMKTNVFLWVYLVKSCQIFSYGKKLKTVIKELD